jgi:hypothetical protein
MTFMNFITTALMSFVIFSVYSIQAMEQNPCNNRLESEPAAICFIYSFRQAMEQKNSNNISEREPLAKKFIARFIQNHKNEMPHPVTYPTCDHHIANVNYYHNGDCLARFELPEKNGYILRAHYEESNQDGEAFYFDVEQ